MNGHSLFRYVLPALIMVIWVSEPAVSEDDAPDSISASKAALGKLGSLIGKWRGVGQVRRNSNRGAWRQSGEFVWDFTSDAPEIHYVVADGQLTSLGRISWDGDMYQLVLIRPDKTQATYRGAWHQNRLVFNSGPDALTVRRRLTITPLNPKRTLVLHEKTAPSREIYQRVAEVGYTREGTRLAVAGAGGRECVVTGGTGTTAVTYQGKTYYVCCSGCKQAFDDDPAGIIADYLARLQKRREKLKDQNELPSADP